MTWPNKITYSRILLIPVFVIAVLKIGEFPFFRYAAIVIFAAIAMGDALDGFIARRFNLSTREGKIVDPLADKLIMVTACVLLALPLWGIPGDRAPLRSEVATVIIARDALICIWVVVAYLAGDRRIFEPTRLGRFTTFTQMLMIAAGLVGTLNYIVLDYVATPLSYAAAALTIASGSQYLYKHATRRNLANNSSPAQESGDDHGA